MSNCTIELLLAASQAAYRLSGQKKIDLSIDDNARFQAMPVINKAGYRIQKTISPLNENKGGLGKTPLSAIRLVPKDNQSPIVIAYRGTKTSKDLIADFKIALTGTIGIKTRKEAYKFYLRTLKRYPGREIILTGHSLGGHIAQYVGAKAYHKNKLPKNLQIRTFNTAPTKTRYGQILNKIREYQENFINYRLNTDLISRIPLQNYYGSTFDFISNIKSSINSHQLWALKEKLPPEILNQKLGSDGDASRNQNELKELITGIKESSRCSIYTKFFNFLFINIYHFINTSIKSSIFLTANVLLKNNYYKYAQELLENKLLNPAYVVTICENLSNLLDNNEIHKAKEYLEKNSDLIHGEKPRQLMHLFLKKITKMINENNENPSVEMKKNLVNQKNNLNFFNHNQQKPECEEKTSISIKNK